MSLYHSRLVKNKKTIKLIDAKCWQGQKEKATFMLWVAVLESKLLT